MRIDIITIFPEMFREVFDFGIVRRAREANLVDVHVHDLRDFTTDKHRSTDDAPYGGGPGMVMKVEPLVSAVEAIAAAEGRLVLLSPRGAPLSQDKVKELVVVAIFGRRRGCQRAKPPERATLETPRAACSPDNRALRG